MPAPHSETFVKKPPLLSGEGLYTISVTPLICGSRREATGTHPFVTINVPLKLKMDGAHGHLTQQAMAQVGGTSVTALKALKRLGFTRKKRPMATENGTKSNAKVEARQQRSSFDEADTEDLWLTRD